MNKAAHFKSTGKAFGLTSVVVPAGMKGFLYLEATNEPAVRAAINGFRGVRASVRVWIGCTAGICKIDNGLLVSFIVVDNSHGIERAKI